MHYWPLHVLSDAHGPGTGVPVFEALTWLKISQVPSTGILLTRVFEPLQGKQPVCWVVQRIQVGPISSRRAGKRHFPNQQSTGKHILDLLI